MLTVGPTARNIIQQLVRVFEVKRLTTSKLHDVRRHQLYNDYVPSAHSGRCRCAGWQTDHQQRALTRRLVHEFNTDGGARRVRLRADERQLIDVQHFEEYLRGNSVHWRFWDYKLYY